MILNCKSLFRLIARSIILLVIFCFAFNRSYAQDMPVPENIQAALLPKVLKFNSNLSDQSKIKIIIVYDNNSAKSKDELIKEIGNSMEVLALRPDKIKENCESFHLIYFMPGLQGHAGICKEYNILSVTGISQYVEQGKISLAFGIQNNKPKIFVNLSSLSEEEQSFSSDILRIAKVYN